MESLVAYWHWYWFMGVLFYYTAVLEKSVGIKYILAIPVRYEPPKGVSVALCGVVYDRFTEQRDFVAAILELKVANLVKIVTLSSGDIVIERTDEQREIAEPHMVALFHNILFAKGNSRYTIPKQLQESVRYGTKRKTVPTPRAKEIIADMLSFAKQTAVWAVEEGYMLQNPRVARRGFFWVSMLFILFALVAGWISGMLPGFFLVILPPFFYLPLYLLVAVKNSYGMKLFALLLMSPILVPILPKLGDPAFREVLFGELHAGYYLLLAVVEVAFILVYEQVTPLTPKGKMVRNHLKGYRRFLVRVKRDEVQRRQAEDPTSTDEVFPYMVLLGVLPYEMHLRQLSSYFHRG